MDRLPELQSHADELEEKCTCPICLCIFNNPRLVVPCCHTLCSDCYTAMYSQGDGKFECPLCRTTCTVAPSSAKRNTAMEDLVMEALRARSEILRQETQIAAPTKWPGQLVSQISCASEPWDLVLVQHTDVQLFYDSVRKLIVRWNLLEPAPNLPPLPQDLLFCIGDDLDDASMFALDGRLLIKSWRLSLPDDQFYDIHRASFDRRNNQLVLSDFMRHKVVLADLTGTVSNIIADLHCPTASCVQVAARRLFVVSNNGTCISSFWTVDYRPTGSACPGFQQLIDIACDDACVYASDSDARQVYLLTADGLGVLHKLSVDGQPNLLQLLAPGLLVVALRSHPKSDNSNEPENRLVLMSSAHGPLSPVKELPCAVKISGLAYDTVRDVLYLGDCKHWVINGFGVAPLTLLAL